MLLSSIFSIWLLAILVLSFTRIKWGVSLYLAYMILVPVTKLEIGSLHLGENVFPFAFLVGYFVYAYQNHLKSDWRPLAPFIFYYLATLCLMPFQDYVPLGYMLNSWRASIMATLFLPFVMWNVMRNDMSCVKLFQNTLLVSITIAVVYGLILTRLGGVNPYVMILMNILNTNQDMESYYDAALTGRIFGRISSVFVHPMSFALFLGLSFIYVFYVRQTLKKTITFILLSALGVMSLVCGVRSVLGALFVAVIYYFLVSRNYKVMFTIIVAGVVSGLIISTMPELSAYVNSIVDIHNENEAVNGSSIDMRLNQLSGAFMEVSRSPIVGLGFGWTGYYMSMYGDHPVMLAFESLIFLIICNFGLAGFIIWGIMIFSYFRKNRSLSNNEIVIFDCLIIYYIAYSCTTGEYGYMKIFLIFYILMMGNSLAQDKKNKFQIRSVRSQ